VSRTSPIGDLHVITDTSLQDRFSHVELARLAAAGGASVIQFREKRPWTTRALVKTASCMAEAIQETSARIVVNDRTDVAVAAAIQGVHLGRDDLDAGIARRILGPDALLGGTANSFDEALRVAEQPVDYLGVGPVFGTRSKADPAPPVGLEGLRDIVHAVRKPVIAIGTITPDRVADVVRVGARGVAVLSAVVAARDPEEATRQLRQKLDTCRNALPPLMLVTDRRATRGRALLDVVVEAVAGGVGMVQVREKDMDDHALESLLLDLKARIPAGVPLLINGRPDLARTLGLGLHLPAGRTDVDVSGIPLVGMSVHDVEEVETAVRFGVHYLVLGTMFPTSSKPGRPGVGPHRIAEVKCAAKGIPILAIGGITAGKVESVLRAGAHGVAVRSGILSAADVKAAVGVLAAALKLEAGVARSEP